MGGLGLRSASDHRPLANLLALKPYGSSCIKKADIERPLPPKRFKSGHLLSDYRQKYVNATRNILMSKARKMTILTFYENVHTGCLF